MNNLDTLKHYWGKPIIVEQGVQVPAPAPLPTQANPDIGAAYELAQKQALAITAVTRANIATCFASVFMPLMREANRRLGPSAPFYITDEAGSTLYIASTGNMNAIQGLASQDIYHPLAKKEKGLDAHAAQHLEQITPMLIPRHGLVFETGAGVDWSRIRQIEQAARAKGSIVICHDLLPASTHLAQQEVPTVPYLALPSRPEFVAPCLRTFRGKPITISLKNTVSSMSFSTLSHPFALAAETGANQVVISQSLGLAQNSNVFLTNMEPFSEALTTQLLQHMLRSHKVPKTGIGVVMLHAHKTMLNAMFEVVRYFAKRFAQQAGLSEHEAYFTEHTAMVAAEDISPILANLPISNAQGLWQAGCFNVVEYSPTGIHKSYDRAIAPGNLKVTTKQFHLRFANQPSQNHIEGNTLDRQALLCPVNRRTSDYIDSLEATAFTSLDPKKMHELLRDHTVTAAIEKVQQVGIQIGLEFMFDTYTRHHPLLQQLPTEEKNRIMEWYLRKGKQR